MLLSIEYSKQNDCPARRQLQFWVFFELRLIDGCLFGRIGYKGQSAIIQLVSYFEAHVRISGYVLIPAAAVRVGEPRGIKGIQVELPLIGDTIDSNGMWNEIPGVGLKFDVLNLVGERPVTGVVTRSPLSHKPGLRPLGSKPAKRATTNRSTKQAKITPRTFHSAFMPAP